MRVWVWSHRGPLAAVVIAMAWATASEFLYAETSHAADHRILIALLGFEERSHVPLSLLEPVVDDTALAGAEQGISDNNTTGRFTGQSYQLLSRRVADRAALIAAFRDLHAQGVRLYLTNLPAEDLLILADLPEAGDSLLFNVAARDDRLRVRECRPNLLHTAPSRAMLADALAQYLAWKRWNRWFLVEGRHPQDQAFAKSLERAAKRFGGKVVERRKWTFEPGARRTDSGHNNAQQEINAFTQVGDYDILLVADEADEFGEYLSYRTYRPRPVGGTQGLTPSAWSRVHEQWGATQFQRRFHKRNGRWMTERDYAAWLAVRSIGEAAVRAGGNDADSILRYLLSGDFKLAAFKGVPVSYRKWNGQLRQPLLIASAGMVVSVSPQRGFLHQFSTLDTLGYDRPEVACEE